MVWSYDPAIPTTRDAVRLHVGDTDTSQQLFSNEEIDYLLGLEDNPLIAAAKLADSAAAKYARQVDKSSDGDSISSSQRFKHFKELAEQLRGEAVRTGAELAAGPYAGGTSYADKETREQDADRVPTAIRTNIHSRDLQELPTRFYDVENQQN